MVLLSISDIYDEFCKYFDGKMKWSAAKDSEWTENILKFFSEFRASKEKLLVGYRLVEAREYMSIDLTWRAMTSSTSHIELAVEHENTGNVKPFLKQEIQHLIDLKADNKIAITYPHIGDEETLVRGVCDAIKTDVRQRGEEYLLLLGFATRTGDPPMPAILIKGHFIDSSGNEKTSKQRVILQATN